MVNNHITKVRSRQRVEPAAVQLVVMWTPTLGRKVGKKIMGENETLVKQTTEKLKSLIAGRILSCAPLAIILILILISTLSSVSFNFNAASRFSQIMNYTMMHVTGTLVFLFSFRKALKGSFVPAMVVLLILYRYLRIQKKDSSLLPHSNKKRSYILTCVTLAKTFRV